jgi:hypothetical protein
LIEFCDRHAAGTCKSFRRPGWIAILVEGSRQRRSAPYDFTVGLMQGYLLDMNSQTAGRGIGMSGAMPEFMLVQQCTQ